MSDRVQYINQFDYGPAEFEGLMNMIRAQLNAGRNLSVAGNAHEGWVLSLPQNRDQTIMRQQAKKLPVKVEDKP